MSGTTTKFQADYAKRVSNCKKCRQQITKGELRLAKLVPNYFASDSANAPELKQYHHPKCLFEIFGHARPSTKVIESIDDIIGWDDVSDDDKKTILEMITDLEEQRSKGNVKKNGNFKTQSNTSKKPSFTKKGSKVDASPSVVGNNANVKTSKESAMQTGTPDAKSSLSTEKLENIKSSGSNKEKGSDSVTSPPDESSLVSTENSVSNAGKDAQPSKFDSFKLFCKLCEVVGRVSKYTDKSAAVNMFVKKEGYDGDVYLLTKLLIPGSDQRVYNLKEKQLIKLFSHIHSWKPEEVSDHYNNSGDVSATIRFFFEKGESHTKKSNLTLHEIDKWLDKLTTVTTEDSQEHCLSWISDRVSPLELQYAIRLIKKDLRINAGAKHILEGICPGSYEVFQNLRDLKLVIDKCVKGKSIEIVDAEISLGVPIKPMLAEPCRSVEQAMKKCVNGMYSEIKYDGERLQLHKNGDSFIFFSRSLRPVADYKVEHLKEVIPEAFPNGNSMILDSEILMVDTTTGKPLPFGTLGIHKKENFENAVVCLFIFDCLYFNGESLINRPLKERRLYLQKNIKEIPNRILLSNFQLIKNGDTKKLQGMVWKAIDEGLEGLVLKDINSVYEPGKRHWLKVKKDYLEDGRMADTADLIVLGAYYGTGAKGGMMSVFLMGVYDESSHKFLTVTKCGNGHDDLTLNRINKELKPKMRKISKDYDMLPPWLKCSRALVPDFVIEDPKISAVWEISGAEFSRSNNHSAMGISIRFPRVTKERNDKNWQTATSMTELKNLYDMSKHKCDLDLSLEDSIPLFSKESLNNPVDFNTSFDGDNEKSKINKRINTHDELLGVPSSKKRKGEKSFFSEKVFEKDDNKVEKPLCKYGKQCYRKNFEHLEKYIHPDSDRNPS